MKTLSVEDGYTSRLLMQELLKGLGPVTVALDGQEAVEAVRVALKDKQPFDLICLDIMMPGLDGQQALRVIREIEAERGFPLNKGAKVIMTTALFDLQSVISAYQGMCDGYLTKPIHKKQLLDELLRLGLIR